MPIIKSTTRKDRGFKQMVNYLYQDDLENGYSYLHNMPLVELDNKEAIVSEFKANDEHRRRIKNGVVIYHEMIAFHPLDREVVVNNPELLEEFTRVYLDERAPNSIALVKAHFDKDHPHLHIMISGNQVKSEKSTRISKKQFLKINQVLEDLQLEKYPELKHSFTSGRGRERIISKKLSYNQKEWKMVERGVRQEEKERLKEILVNSLHQVRGARKFKERLEAKGVRMYKYRGKYNGIEFEGSKRRYRFTKFMAKGSIELAQVKKWTAELANEKEQKLDRDFGLELSLGLEKE